MKQTNALKDKLERLTKVFHPENKKIEVRLQKGNPHVSKDGDYISIWPNVGEWLGKRNLSKSNELRILINVLSHEVEHIVQSDCRGKEKFMENHPKAPEVAGFIYNSFEDVYVDFKRTNRLRGMRIHRAFLVTVALSNSHRHPSLTSIDSKEEKTLEGILQICLQGYADGISDIDDDELKRLLSYIRLKTKETRHIDDHENRVKLYDEVFERLTEFFEIEELENKVDETDNPYSVPVDTSEMDFEEGEDVEEGEESDRYADISEENDDKNENEYPHQQSSNVDNTYNDESEDTEGDEDDNDFPDNQELVDEDDLPDDLLDGESSNFYDDSLDKEGDDSQFSLDDFKGDDTDDNSNIEEVESSDKNSQVDKEGLGNDGEHVGEGCELSTDRDGVEEGGDSKSKDAEGLNELLEEMEAVDEGDKEFGWYDVDTDSESFYEPSEKDKKLISSIREKTNRSNMSIEEAKEKRDEHAEKFDINEDRILETLKEKGLDKEIEKVFEEIKNDHRDIPVRDGDSIHMENAIQYKSGDYSIDRLYSLSLPVETGKRSVSVCVDLSGSVPEHVMKVALLGLQRACETIGDEFMASGFKTFNSNSHTIQYTPLITGPRESFRLEHLSAVFSDGMTPLPAGLKKANELLENSTRPEELIIVLTDGKPNIELESGNVVNSRGKRNNKSVQQSSDIVDSIREEKTTVLGIGFGSVNRNIMEEIFGEDGYVMGDIDDLANRLLEVYMKQMDVLELHKDYRSI